MLPYLHVLFNKVFYTGQFPEQWCESIISPIHKKGSKIEPINSISLCKIVVHVLTKRLPSCCGDYNVIEESQAGFRSQYSTIDNVFTLNGIIQKYLSKRKGDVMYFI